MHLVKAVEEDIAAIWKILESAIERRRLDGSEQWQDGYPNMETLANDVDTESGYVLMLDGQLVAYVCIKINDEPEYDNIVGTWLTSSDFVVLHRVAVSKDYLGIGLAKEIFRQAEYFALERGIYSIKVDTNFDNIPMLRILESLDYTYCGFVYFRGAERRAFEKVLG